MTIKDLLLYLDQSPESRARLEAAIELADQLERGLGGCPRHRCSRMQGGQQVGHRGPRMDITLEDGGQVLDIAVGGNSSLRTLETGAERIERAVHRIGGQRMLPCHLLGVERAGRRRVARICGPGQRDRSHPSRGERDE